MFDSCMYFNTTALARALEREWAAAFSPFDLTPPQGFMLRAVLERPGMLQNELASLFGIARPTATRGLDGLEAKKLIERRRGERDGRESSIHPTVKGEALRDALNHASGAVTARLKRRLGSDHFGETVQHVKKVRASLE